MKKVRQILFIAIFCLVGCAFFAPADSAQAATKKITKIKITNVVNGKRTMVKGKPITLTTSISPSKATYKTLRWTSSKPSVVSVNSKGKLTAKKKGTAVITASARDGSGKKVSVTITVGTQVSKVDITTTAGKKLYVGKTLKLSTKVSSSKASNKDLVYSSSNTSIATVSSKGVVKAVGVPSGKKSATVTIKVKAADGSGKYDTYKVTVLRPVTKITAAKSKIIALPGKTVSAGCSASPTTAYNTKLVYKSSNTKVATVSTDGKVTTHQLGSANITATSTDGSAVKKSVAVNVVATLTKIVVPTSTQKLVVGETYTIDPQMSPEAVDDLGATYTSSNTSILTVSSSGKVTAKKAGNANVYVKAKDSAGTTVTVKFNVKNYSDITYKKSQFVAHTGSSTEAPQNSIPAFKIAGQSKKYMGIETDIHETKDGKFVVIHDNTLTAMTNKSGSIHSMTLAEIREATINAGSNISKYKGLQVPTLQEYLYICKVYGMRPVLHIKYVTSTGYQKIINILNEVGIKNKAIITGGLTYMKKFKSLDSSLDVYWLCYLTDSNIETAAQYKLNMNVDYSMYVTQTRIEKVHAKGMKIGAWTISSTGMNNAKKLLNKGIDFVTTNMYSAIDL